jgi:hypothetical protein
MNTKYIQDVEVEGEWPDHGLVIAHYANGDIEEEDLSEATNWDEAVEILKDHADDMGTQLEYLQASC